MLLGSITLSQAQSKAPNILVIGDSLSAEYGLVRGSGWIALLQDRLKKAQRPERLVNAGISGDTTAGGRSRLPALLAQHKPAILIIELGANDALRGMPLASTKANLTAMVQAGQKAGAKVLLIGMEVPPNYGARYTQDFRDVFKAVAAEQKTALLPFLLAGVADRPDALSLFQADRIHPNESAQPILAANVWPALQKLLAKK
ncbi:MAG: arylesterase [Hydrogenophaga sp.]